jgi:hypothetical protein
MKKQKTFTRNEPGNNLIPNSVLLHIEEYQKLGWREEDQYHVEDLEKLEEVEKQIKLKGKYFFSKEESFSPDKIFIGLLNEWNDGLTFGLIFDDKMPLKDFQRLGKPEKLECLIQKTYVPKNK